MRKLYLAAWLFVGLSGALAFARTAGPMVPSLRYTHPPVSHAVQQDLAGRWFADMRPFCNPVEVETRHRWSPPPSGMRGAGFSAACFALAGRVDRSRAILDALGSDDRWRAAGIVFNVGHPVADAGDDEAAGPIMELVVEYWPNHHMALYHAGMARYGLGDHEAASDYLGRFLEHYEIADGWTRAAESALAELDS